MSLINDWVLTGPSCCGDVIWCTWRLSNCTTSIDYFGSRRNDNCDVYSSTYDMRSAGIFFFLALKNFSIYSIKPKPISLKPTQDKRIRQLVSGVPCRVVSLTSIYAHLNVPEKPFFISHKYFWFRSQNFWFIATALEELSNDDAIFWR